MKDRELLDTLMTAMGKQPQSLGIVISTQAATDDHPLSQLIDDGLAGLDPSLHVQLIAAPPEADPFSEEHGGPALFVSDSAFGLLGLTRNPKFVAPGINSCSRPNCFATNRLTRKLTPVTLPPGRLRLATRPNLTGSPPTTNT
jgi:hypothetical protein